jgi:hypothetical protein
MYTNRISLRSRDGHGFCSLEPAWVEQGGRRAERDIGIAYKGLRTLYMSGTVAL